VEQTPLAVVPAFADYRRRVRFSYRPRPARDFKTGVARLVCAGWFDSIPSPPRSLREYEKRGRFVIRESEQIVLVDA
jgi:hypothetical protein